MNLILASTSPRRQELLATLKLPFTVISPRFEEIPSDKIPAEEVQHQAFQKALSIATLYPEAHVIGSDTLVALGLEKLGKPKDDADAVQMLQKLSGKIHSVWTAVVLLHHAKQTMKVSIDQSFVVFRPLSPEEIHAYVATGEPLDKAGAYAVQGEGRKLISKIEGREDTIIGLTMEPLAGWLGGFK